MTRRRCLGLLGVLALLSTAVRAQEEPPPVFKSEAGRFSVAFAAKPTEQKQTSTTPGGNIDIFLFLLVRPTTVYLVGYGDYPEQAVKEAGAEALLEGDRDGFAKAVKGKVASSKKIKLDGEPGLEFTVEAANKRIYLVREYMVKNRLYQVVSGGAELSNPELKKFQDSFKVLK